MTKGVEAEPFIFNPNSEKRADPLNALLTLSFSVKFQFLISSNLISRWL